MKLKANLLLIDVISPTVYFKKKKSIDTLTRLVCAIILIHATCEIPKRIKVTIRFILYPIVAHLRRGPRN
jgi:hypothetical protein